MRSARVVSSETSRMLGGRTLSPPAQPIATHDATSQQSTRRRTLIAPSTSKRRSPGKRIARARTPRAVRECAGQRGGRLKSRPTRSEPAGEDVFQAQLPGFGGVTLGCATLAAARTTELALHSLHVYFLRAVPTERPALLRVERVRD